jgi:hypothetical protein
MATPVVEQNAQKCPFMSPACKSAQKWNCAARKTNASKIAQIVALRVEPGMVTNTVSRKSQFLSTGKWKVRPGINATSLY